MSRERSKRLRSRDSQTRWYSTRAWFGKGSFLLASTENSMISTAQCHRQQNGKGRTQLASTTWRAGSASTSDRQRLERRPDRTSLPLQRWLQRQQAEFQRPSRAAFNEPCRTHRRPGKRLKRLRGFAGYNLWRSWWKGRLRRGQSPCTSARQSCFAGRRQKSSHVGKPGQTLAQLLLVAHGHARSFLPHFAGALCGLPQGTRFGAGQQRSLEECESYFHLPPRGDGCGGSGSSHSDASVRCSLQCDFGEL